jgi:flotillin
MKEADSAFYAKKKEAEGIQAMAAAYKEMASVFGGPQGFLQYMMLQNNTYEKLAKANASAVQGLQPKITVWNTGSEASTADAGAPIRNLFQSLPPLLGTIHEQTGMRPPTWFAQMPEMGNEAKPVQMQAKTKSVNGV